MNDPELTQDLEPLPLLSSPPPAYTDRHCLFSPPFSLSPFLFVSLLLFLAVSSVIVSVSLYPSFLFLSFSLFLSFPFSISLQHYLFTLFSISLFFLSLSVLPVSKEAETTCEGRWCEKDAQERRDTESQARSHCSQLLSLWLTSSYIDIHMHEAHILLYIKYILGLWENSGTVKYRNITHACILTIHISTVLIFFLLYLKKQTCSLDFQSNQYVQNRINDINVQNKHQKKRE